MQPSAGLTHPGLPGLRLGPLPRPTLMARAPLQYIRTYTRQHTLGQVRGRGTDADGQHNGITCGEHGAVTSVPADTQSSLRPSPPPSLPFARRLWAAHLTSLSLYPPLLTKTPGLPSSLPAHVCLTRRPPPSCRCSGLAGPPWG